MSADPKPESPETSLVPPPDGSWPSAIEPTTAESSAETAFPWAADSVPPAAEPADLPDAADPSEAFEASEASEASVPSDPAGLSGAEAFTPVPSTIEAPAPSEARTAESPDTVAA
ncbi:hypothetical protein MXD58_025095, partial [Frankia sp. AgKG'84/4]|nr:hypothetical protein [Frankia sp. AgKG'84/4]